MKKSTSGATRACHARASGALSGACSTRQPVRPQRVSSVRLPGSVRGTERSSAAYLPRSVSKPAGKASRSRAWAPRQVGPSVEPDKLSAARLNVVYAAQRAGRRAAVRHLHQRVEGHGVQRHLDLGAPGRAVSALLLCRRLPLLPRAAPSARRGRRAAPVASPQLAPSGRGSRRWSRPRGTLGA